MAINIFVKTVTMVLVFSLSACATTKHHPLENKAKKGFVELPNHLERNKKLKHPKYKVGTTYKIKGKSYTPYENFAHEEVGMASWYGADCHGKKTAIGERFNMHGLTCAHRTLQMPCKVKVTNLENGRSVVLTVADRGPYAKNRILDISREGARRLGFINKGHAKIHLKVLQEPSLMLAGITKRRGVRESSVTRIDGKAAKMPEFQLASLKPEQIVRKPKKKGPVYIQAGAFKNYRGASSLSRKLSKYAPAYIASTEIKGQNHYRVRLGPFKSPDHAKSVMAQITPKDCGDAKILQIG